MEADPVVGEHRVGLGRIGRVRGDADLYALALEPGAQRREFGQRAAWTAAAASLGADWNRLVLGGVDVEAEAGRPDHPAPGRCPAPALCLRRRHACRPACGAPAPRSRDLSRRGAPWVQNAPPCQTPFQRCPSPRSAPSTSRRGSAPHSSNTARDRHRPRHSAALIERFLALFHGFFALPEAEKRRHHLPGGGGARGYTPFGIETAKGALHPTSRSSGTSAASCRGPRLRRYMPPNVWVESLPGFRELTLEMFESFDRMGRRLLAPIALAVAAAGLFEDRCNSATACCA